MSSVNIANAPSIN